MENNSYLKEYKEHLQTLTKEELKERDLYLKKLNTGEIYGPITGLPSIDKPWLKYYKDEYITCDVPSSITVEEFLEKQNADNMDSIAINSPEGKYTYAELIKMNYRVAASLKAIGVQKKETVIGMFPTIAHEVFLFYGSDINGSAVNYPIPNTPADEIVNTINELGVKHVFIFSMMLTEELKNAILEKTNIEKIIVIDFGQRTFKEDKIITWEEFLSLGKNLEVTTIDRTAEDLLFMAKTGGSTGKSKNVMLNDRSFNVIVNQLLHTDLPYEKKDKWIRMWPLFSATAAVSSSHLPLCAGMELILRDVLDLNDFPDLVLEEKPNHLTLIPVYLEALKRSEKIKKADLSFIKSWGCGGAKITEMFEKEVDEFQIAMSLYNLYLGQGYGLTENASSAAMRMNKETTKIGTVGIPLVKTTVSAFDKNGNELYYGEEGELCVKSESFMMGYLNSPELTSSAIQTHPDGEVWLHTGDIGSIDNDGFVSVAERIKRVIDVYPVDSVYPSSVEEVIASIPGVMACAIVGAPDPYHENFQVPVCFAVLDENVDPEITRNLISSTVSSRFPKYYWLDDVILKSSLPLTNMGKPNYPVLESELNARYKKLELKK